MPKHKKSLKKDDAIDVNAIDVDDAIEIKTISAEEKDNKRERLIEMGDGKISQHLLHLFRSRHKAVYIRSYEETRVIDCLRSISLVIGLDLYQWDISRGLLDSHSLEQVKSESSEVHESPNAVMSHIIEHAKSDRKYIEAENMNSEGHVYLLLDFHMFLRDNPELQRKIKEFAEISSSCCIVIISPIFECPETLDKEFTLIDFPYPSKPELKRALNEIKKDISLSFPKATKFALEHEEEILDATTGMTLNEATNAYYLSLITKKNFDIPTIIDEKKQIIKKKGILEFRDSRFTFDDVGGLNTLEKWLQTRRVAFSSDATEYGLQLPQGCLLTGIPGCGKSLVCDALASYWQMPLLRLDMGAIFGSHVGESEQNIRDVIQTSDAVSPAVLWIDEIEKGIGGVQSSNQTDGGVTNRVFGTLLTWMQEKTASVFVICTANNVLSIPPEFMRAGRFDEIFFVDLPDSEQRMDVIEKLLRRKHRDPTEFDIYKIADHSKNYSPAEIEKGINNGMFVAYSDKRREVTTKDIVSEIGKFQPLYNSRRDEIEDMRRWALGEDKKGGRAVLANSPPTKKRITKKHIPKRHISLSSTLSETDL